MITLKQEAGTFNIYIVPNADGCNIGLTPYGAANNYQCIDDPVDIPDDDISYVSSSATDVLYDLYKLPDDSITDGTINYVQVYTRAKSHVYPQSEDGTYKILVTDDACANIYKSDNIGLITGYSLYSNIWLENPRTSAEWTLADLNNLQIGIECSSPTVTAVIKSSTFRPNESGDLTQLAYDNVGGWWDGQAADSSVNYTMVDESIADDLGTYVYTNFTDRMDLYSMPSHTTEVGTIQNITLFFKIATQDSAGDFYPIIKSWGTIYSGTAVTYLGENWKLYSYTWSSNPSTGGNWEWDDIDQLQIGIRINSIGTNKHACTQLYLVVNYLDDTNPEIRTTQCYAKVNYTTDSECTLQNPEEIEMNQSQIINIINFWDGEREVYGIARGNKTMLMMGKEWDDAVLGIDADTRIGCVKQMAKTTGEIYVDIGGAGSKEFDGTFRLLSFGWKKISDLPKTYDWMLEFEAVD